MGTAYNEWLSLFDKNVENIWQNNPLHFRKIAMIYHILGEELKRMQHNYKEQNERSNSNNKCDKSNKNEDYSTILMDEPNGFDFMKNFDKKKETFTSQNPFVNKRKDDISNKENKIFNSPLPVNDESSFHFFKPKYKEPEMPKVLSQSDDEDMFSSSPTLDYKRNIKMKRDSKYTNQEINLKTPNNKDQSIMSDTCVDCTPEIEIKTKKSFKLSLNSCKTKSTLRKTPYKNQSKKQTMTLTQMLSDSSRKQSQDNDVDITFASNNSLEFNDDFDDDLTCVTMKSPIKKSSCGNTRVLASKNNIDCDLENKAKRNKPSDFAEKYDMFPKEEEKNEKNYVYKETVRGNARKKLNGWDCKECKQFYEQLDLSPNKLQKLKNECSKHKSKFKPPDETPPYIWDLNTMSTQEF